MSEAKLDWDAVDAAVDRLLSALEKERRRSSDLEARVTELELELRRAPKEIESLRDENGRLRRNMAVAAQKVEEVLERL